MLVGGISSAANPLAAAYRRDQEVGIPGVAAGDYRLRGQAPGAGAALQMDPSLNA